MSKLIVANWKMMLNARQSRALAQATVRSLRGKRRVPEIVVCPSFVFLSDIQKTLKKSRVQLGAQDLFWESEGAYTGEIASGMLVEVGCSYVIIGHSERRQLLGETDGMIAKKFRAALEGGLIPILCVGETYQENRSGKGPSVVRAQLESACAGIPSKLLRFAPFAIAYEPLWAIGKEKKREPLPADVLPIEAIIREFFESNYSSTIAERFTFLYGGNVASKNINTFLQESVIQGVLVGGASARISEWKGILKTVLHSLMTYS